MNFIGLVKTLAGAAKKRSPELLIGIGIGGMFTAMIMVAKKSPKMHEDLEEIKNDKEMPKKEKQKEQVKTVAKHQWPAAVIFLLSVAAIASADRIHCKRNAAMAIVVEASEAAVHEYNNIMREVAGEEKAKEVQRIYEERTREEPHHEAPTNVHIITGDEYWIYDEFTNTMFKGNTIMVESAVNECNRRIFEEMYISLNDFYEEMGVKEAKINSAVGWNNNTDLIRIAWSAKMINGKPVAVLTYTNPPQEGFRESW